MRNTAHRFFAALALTLFVTACDAAPTAPRAAATAETAAPTADIAATAADGNADVWRDHYRYPINQLRWVPCANGGAGELVRVTGTIHTRTQINSLDSGGWRIAIHYNGHGLRGEGRTTGAQYVANTADGGMLNITDGATTQLFTSRFRMIGRGGADKFFYTFTDRYTVDANGEMRVEVFDERIECR